MKNKLQKLQNAWLAPMPPERLGLIRILVGLFSLWYLVSRYDMFMEMAANDPLLYEPVGVAVWLTSPLSVPAFMWLFHATLALNIAFILGWQYRLTGPLFALSFLFFMCYRNSWSMLYHNYNILVLHVLVIGFTLAAGAVSLDSRKGRMALVPNWHFGWPVRLLSALTVVTYFLSGLAKIYGDLALEWVTGEAMRSQVAVDGIRKEILADGVQPFFEWLYPHTEIFLMMGVVAMIVELGAPLALAGRKIGMAWAVLALSMHWGIFFIMGIKFPYHYSGFIYLSFFPLEYLLQRGKQLFRRSDKQAKVVPLAADSQLAVADKALILFDGVCNLCNSSVQFVLRNDRAAHFQFASLQSEQGQQLLQQHGLAADLSSIVLLEGGHAYTASTAALRIARSLRFPMPILAIGLLLPKFLRDAVYSFIARNRYRWFGQSESCMLPSPVYQARFLK